MAPSEVKTVILSTFLPAFTAYDVQWGFCLCLGMLAGWLARAGRDYQESKSWGETYSRATARLLMGGGAAITTLIIARIMAADALAVTGIAFVVTWRGDSAFAVITDHVVNPIIDSINKHRPKL